MIRSNVLPKFLLFYALTASSFFSLTFLTHNTPPQLAENWFAWFNVISIFGTISAFRYDTAIGLVKSKRISISLSLISLLISFSTNTIFFVGLVFAKHYSLIDVSYSRSFFVSILGFLNSCISIFANLQLSFGNINRYNFFLVFPQVLTPLVQVCLFKSFGYQQSLFFTAAVISYSSILILAFAFNHKFLRKSLSPHSLPSIKRSLSLLKRRKNFPFYLTPFTFAVHTRDKFIYGILATIPNSYSIALMTMAQKVVNLSHTAISSPVRPIFFRQSLILGLNRTKKSIPRLLVNLSLLVLPAWMILILNADQIFAFFFGAQWSGVSVYFRILSPSFFIIALTGWMDRLYEINGQQKQLLFTEIIFSLLMVVSLLVVRWKTENVFVVVSTMSLATALYGWWWLSNTFRLLKLSQIFLLKLFILQSLIFLLFSSIDLIDSTQSLKFLLQVFLGLPFCVFGFYGILNYGSTYQS